MNSFTVRPVTAESLPDLVALITDPADAAKRLNVLRERLAGGQFKPERALILYSDRGVEGDAVINVLPQVPVFPNLRFDAPQEAITLLAHAIREQAGPEQQLVLQDDQAPLQPAPFEAAGWIQGSQFVVYETDLQARTYPLDPQAQTISVNHPDIRRLLDLLKDQGRPELELSEDWTLIALPGTDGLPAALGAVGPDGRPDSGGINMIGVLPQVRGQGLGTRLNAHLLALAAQKFARHGGGTSADNAAMQRIFDKHGSRLIATQMYFKQES